MYHMIHMTTSDANRLRERIMAFFLAMLTTPVAFFTLTSSSALPTIIFYKLLMFVRGGDHETERGDDVMLILS